MSSGDRMKTASGIPITLEKSLVTGMLCMFSSFRMIKFNNNLIWLQFKAFGHNVQKKRIKLYVAKLSWVWRYHFQISSPRGPPTSGSSLAALDFEASLWGKKFLI